MDYITNKVYLIDATTGDYVTESPFTITRSESIVEYDNGDGTATVLVGAKVTGGAATAVFKFTRNGSVINNDKSVFFTTGTITPGDEPFGMAICPSKNRVYFTALASKKVYECDYSANCSAIYTYATAPFRVKIDANKSNCELLVSFVGKVELLNPNNAPATSTVLINTAKDGLNYPIDDLDFIYPSN